MSVNSGIILTNSSTDDEQKNPILPKLKLALSAAGDFPIRSQVVARLKATSSKPNVSINEIKAIILAEPALDTRIIHLVNSAYCTNSSSITTISQAIIQIGMRNLVDLCSGLIQVQKLVSGNQSQSSLVNNLKRSMLTSIVTSQLVSNQEPENDVSSEEAYIAGSFYCLGNLLLSYYFPQVYETANKRAKSRGLSLEKSISELLGTDRSRLNLGIADALKIPDFYRAVLIETSEGTLASSSVLTRALWVADTIVLAMLEGKAAKDLEEVIIKIASSQSFFSEKNIRSSILCAGMELVQKRELSGLQFMSLPIYFDEFFNDSMQISATELEEASDHDDESIGPEFNDYIEELKEAAEVREPISSVIASVMEAIAFGLGFDRVILLLVNGPRTALIGRMSLGKTVNFDPKSIARSLNDIRLEGAVDILAFMTGNLSTKGEPLLKDAGGYVALPIGFKNGSLGVIYADKLGISNPPPGRKVEACLSILIDILDEAVQTSS